MKEETRKGMAQVFNQAMGEDMEAMMDTPIDKSGITSLSFIKFIVAVEEQFDIEVDNQYLSLSQYETVGDFVEVCGNIIDNYNN